MLTAIILGTILSIAGVAAAEGDATYFLDADNILYVYTGDTYSPCAVTSAASIKTAEPASTPGFGEGSAEWRYSKTSNGYTVKHKGWKERESQQSLYGVRACCTTVCTPSKTFWNKASMTTAAGTEVTTSGKHRGTGTIQTKSPYNHVRISEACMRSTWGDVGTVVSQW